MGLVLQLWPDKSARAGERQPVGGRLAQVDDMQVDGMRAPVGGKRGVAVQHTVAVLLRCRG